MIGAPAAVLNAVNDALAGPGLSFDHIPVLPLRTIARRAQREMAADEGHAPDPAPGQRPRARAGRGGPAHAGRHAPRTTSATPAPTWAVSTASAARARCWWTARPVRSCLMFGVQADGTRGQHGRGPGRRRGLSDLQQSFSDHHGLQCGFCTPGFLMLAEAYLAAAAARRRGADRGGDPRAGRGQPVPVHRLPGHRRGGAGHRAGPAAARGRAGPGMSVRTRARGRDRRAGAAQGGPAAAARAAAGSATTSRPRASCGRGWSAPRSRTAGCARWTSPRPAAADGVAAAVTAADLPAGLADPGPAGRAGHRPEPATCSRCWPPTWCATSASRWPWWSPRTRTLAEDAAELVDIDIDEARPCWTPRRRPAGRAAPVPGGNVAAEFTLGYGDVAAAFARAAHVVETEVAIGRHSGVPLEPRALLAEPDPRTGGAGDLRHDQGAGVQPGPAGRDARHGRDPDPRARGRRGRRVRRRAASSTPRTSWCRGWPGRCGRPVKWAEDRAEHLVAVEPLPAAVRTGWRPRSTPAGGSRAARRRACTTTARTAARTGSPCPS